MHLKKFCFCFLCLIAAAWADSTLDGLMANNPFLPPVSATPAFAVPSPFSCRSVSFEEGVPIFSVRDGRNGRARWMRLHEVNDGLELLGYDAAKRSLTAKYQDLYVSFTIADKAEASRAVAPAGKAPPVQMPAGDAESRAGRIAALMERRQALRRELLRQQGAR